MVFYATGNSALAVWMQILTCLVDISWPLANYANYVGKS
jgi:hypothetical protein